MTKGKKCSIVVAEEGLANKEGLKVFHQLLKENKQIPTLAYNAIGGTITSLLAKIRGPGGTMVTQGGMSKQPVTVSTPHFIFKDLRYFGYWHSQWMSERGYKEKKAMIDMLVDSVLEGGGSCPPPVQEFPLSDFQEAL